MIERCENLFIPWQCHSHKWSDWGRGNRPCRDKIRLDRDNRPELSEVEFRTRRPESLHNHPIPSICKKLFFLFIFNLMPYIERFAKNSQRNSKIAGYHQIPSIDQQKISQDKELLHLESLWNKNIFFCT